MVQLFVKAVPPSLYTFMTIISAVTENMAEIKAGAINKAAVKTM